MPNPAKEPGLRLEGAGLLAAPGDTVRSRGPGEQLPAQGPGDRDMVPEPRGMAGMSIQQWLMGPEDSLHHQLPQTQDKSEANILAA